MALSLNPDGSPTKALDDFRKRKIRERKDKGQITPHFHLNEFHTKDARGSALPVKSWAAVIRLCQDYLEPMRKKFGSCTVISGYRHRAYNNTLPGASLNSQHIYDETPESVAADTRYERGSVKEWVAHAKTLRAGLGNKGGIGRYDRDGFIHIDNRFPPTGIPTEVSDAPPRALTGSVVRGGLAPIATRGLIGRAYSPGCSPRCN